MSTILKALRRLEEDRSFEESRSLQERVTGGLGEQPRGSSRFKTWGRRSNVSTGAGV